MKRVAIVFSGLILVAFNGAANDYPLQESIVQNFFPADGISFTWETTFERPGAGKAQKSKSSVVLDLKAPAVKVTEYDSDGFVRENSYINGKLTSATISPPPSYGVGVISRGTAGEIMPALFFPWLAGGSTPELAINENSIKAFKINIGKDGGVVLSDETYVFKFYPKTYNLEKVEYWVNTKNEKPYLLIRYSMRDYVKCGAFYFPLEIKNEIFEKNGGLHSTSISMIDKNSLYMGNISPEAVKINFPIGSNIRDEINNKRIVVSEVQELGGKEDAIVNILDSLVDKAQEQKNGVEKKSE